MKKFKNQRILVVGEAFLDTYVYGFSERISREAPVPIVDVVKSVYIPGGAANTAMNIAALSGNATFLSVIGDDQQGKMVTDTLQKNCIDLSPLIIDNKRETIEKKRIIADGQILLRYDSGSCEPITGRVEETFINHLIEYWAEVDAIIVSDYGYGIITDVVLHAMQILQQKIPRLLFIDSKYLDRFHNIQPTAVKPNYSEAVALLGITKMEHGEKRVSQIRDHKEELLQRTNASLAAVTIDADGALIFDQNGSTYRTYAQRVENPKGVGAGDTYVAALTLALASGGEIRTAAEIAANATKVIITKEGTASCTILELERSVTNSNKYINDIQTLEKIVQVYKKEGKKIVSTNGCFDILHTGHVRYLNQAKSYGDILILGVNTDQSIRKIKGSHRPINSLHDRISVFAALSCIDFIVPIPEETGCNFVEIVRPDVYVKGSDYTLSTLPEAKIVTKYGGNIVFIPLTKGKSTSNIIAKIQQSTSKTGLNTNLREL